MRIIEAERRRNEYNRSIGNQITRLQLKQDACYHPVNPVWQTLAQNVMQWMTKLHKQTHSSASTALKQTARSK